MTYDPHKSTTEARQGDSRRANLRVLVWSTVGIVVVFAILVAIWFSMTPNTPPGA